MRRAGLSTTCSFLNAIAFTSTKLVSLFCAQCLEWPKAGPGPLDSTWTLSDPKLLNFVWLSDQLHLVVDPLQWTSFPHLTCPSQQVSEHHLFKGKGTWADNIYPSPYQRSCPSVSPMWCKPCTLDFTIKTKKDAYFFNWFDWFMISWPSSLPSQY